MKIRKKTNLILFVGLISLISCTKRNKIHDPLIDFQDFNEVSSTKLVSSNSLFRVRELLLVDDILLAKDQELDYSYKLIDVTQDRFLKKFGKLGEGPCELGDFASISRSGKIGDKLGVFEFQSGKYQEFLINGLLDSVENPACIPFNGRFDSGIRNISKIRNSVFVGTSFGAKPYVLLKETKAIQSVGEYPFQDQFDKIDPMTLALANQVKLFKHPTKPYILSASYSSFNMDILELDQEEKLRIKKSLHFWPTEFEDNSNGSSFGATIKKDNRFGNISTSVSNNYIYVLFNDKPWEFQFPLKSNQVLVYDWDGNSVKIIELDREISMLAVHQDDDYLIGYLDDGNANLFRFELD